MTSGLLLIAKKLNGSDNYGTWKRSMLIALSAKNKLKLINEEYEEPSVTSSLRAYWERANDMLISWILNTVSEQIDGHRIYQIANEIVELKQSNCTIDVYYHKLKGLWDELDATEAPYACTSIMARSTFERGSTNGSVCGPEDELNTKSSHARRHSDFIKQAPGDPSKRPMITLDGGGFADTKVSRTITTIFKNMFNGSWTTWKEVNKSDRDELWAYFKWEVVTDVLVREVWEDTMKNCYPNIMLKARNELIKMTRLVGVQFDGSDFSVLNVKSSLLSNESLSSQTIGVNAIAQSLVPKVQFNLQLSSKEKSDRAKVLLPCEHQETGKSIQIYDGCKSLNEYVQVLAQLREITSRYAQEMQKDQLPSNEPGALMNLDVNAAFVSEDDEETRACKSLFQNKTFFLGREVPWSNEHPLENKEFNAIIGAWFTLWLD
ncbi:cysteine-rich receptor-like protein kinase 8 [Tanacetum coccineum]